MATFSNMNDGFYDDPSTRSPRVYRGQHLSVNRGNSRHIDNGYGSMQGNMFANNNSFANNHAGHSLRFTNGPFPPSMQNNMQNGPVGNIQFAFDSSAAQTWNAGSNGIPNFATGMLQDASRSVRPSRGRTGISNVCLTFENARSD